MAMCGGTGSVRPADPEVQAICDQVRSEVEKTANGSNTFSSFEAVSVRTQVVAGTNYFVKVKTGDDAFVHVRIYQDLSQKLEVSAVKANQKDADSLEYFA